MQNVPELSSEKARREQYQLIFSEVLKEKRYTLLAIKDCKELDYFVGYNFGRFNGKTTQLSFKLLEPSNNFAADLGQFYCINDLITTANNELFFQLARNKGEERYECAY